MKTLIITCIKVFALWVTILVSSIIANSVLTLTTEVVADGPLTGGEAFLLVNLMHALILAVVAHNSTVRGFSLALLVGLTLFSAQSFLLLLEAFYFIDDLKISQLTLVISSGQVLIISVFTGAASALLWRQGKLLAVHKKTLIQNLPLRISLISLLYVVSYFIAGSYIAWTSNDVQAFYSFGEDIKLLPLLSFQLFRGVLWGLLAAYMFTCLSGSGIKRSLIVGSSFSILAIAQLLYPNIYMPWEVRLIHMIEVGISNFMFGSATVLILLYKKEVS